MDAFLPTPRLFPPSTTPSAIMILGMGKNMLIVLSLVLFMLLVEPTFAAPGLFKVKYSLATGSPMTIERIKAHAQTNCGGLMEVRYLLKQSGFALIGVALNDDLNYIRNMVTQAAPTCQSADLLDIMSSETKAVNMNACQSACSQTEVDCQCEADTCSTQAECTSAQYCDSGAGLCKPLQDVFISIQYANTAAADVEAQLLGNCGGAMAKVYHLLNTKVIVLTQKAMPGTTLAALQSQIQSGHPNCFSTSDFTWTATSTACSSGCGGDSSCPCDPPRKVYFKSTNPTITQTWFMDHCDSSANKIVVTHVAGVVGSKDVLFYGTFATVVSTEAEMLAVLSETCQKQSNISQVSFAINECQAKCGFDDLCACPAATECTLGATKCASDLECRLPSDEAPDTQCLPPDVETSPVSRTLSFKFNSNDNMLAFSALLSSTCPGLKRKYSLVGSYKLFLEIQTIYKSRVGITADFETVQSSCASRFRTLVGVPQGDLGAYITLVAKNNSCENKCGSTGCECELYGACDATNVCADDYVCHKSRKICSKLIPFTLKYSATWDGTTPIPSACNGELLDFKYVLPVQKLIQLSIPSHTSNVYAAPSNISAACLAAVGATPASFTLTSTLSCSQAPGNLACWAESACDEANGKYCLPNAFQCTSNTCVPALGAKHSYTVIFIGSRFPYPELYAALNIKGQAINPCYDSGILPFFGGAGEPLFQSVVWQVEETSTVAFRVESSAPSFDYLLGAMATVAPSCLAAFGTSNIIEGSMLDMTCDKKCGFQAFTGASQPCLCGLGDTCTVDRDCLNSADLGQQLSCDQTSKVCIFRRSNTTKKARYLAASIPSDLSTTKAQRLFLGYTKDEPTTPSSDAFEAQSLLGPAEIMSTLRTQQAYQLFGELQTETINGPCQTSSNPTFTLNFIYTNPSTGSRTAYLTIYSSVATVADLATLGDIPTTCFEAFGGQTAFAQLSPSKNVDTWACRTSCGASACPCQVNQVCTTQDQCQAGLVCSPAATSVSGKTCQIYVPAIDFDPVSTDFQLVSIRFSYDRDDHSGSVADWAEHFKTSLGACFTYQTTIVTSPDGHSGYVFGVSSEKLLQNPDCSEANIKAMVFGTSVTATEIKFAVAYDFPTCAVQNSLSGKITRLKCGQGCSNMPCTVGSQTDICTSSSDCAYGSCISNPDGGNVCNSALSQTFTNLVFVLFLFSFAYFF